MGSVRKVAVTAGLGAAIVTGAAAPALAADHLAAPQAPAVPKVAQENIGMIGPFGVSQVTDTLGTEKVTQTVTDTAARTLPPVTGAPTFPGLPVPPPPLAPAEAPATPPAAPDLGVPGVADAADAVTAGVPAAPGLPGVVA